MIYVNTSSETSIFQYSKRKLPHFQLKPEISLLQWVIGMLVSLFHTSGFGVETLFRIVLNMLVLEEVAFQTVNDGVYRRLISPKKKTWPKFPLNLGSLVIPTSTWAAVLGEQIQSLKLGFASKRKHDQKGLLDAHFK